MNVLFIRATNRISGAEVYNFYLGEGLSRYTDITPIFLTDCKEFYNTLKELRFNSYFIPFNIREIGTKKDFLIASLWIIIYFYIYLKALRKINRIHKLDLICLESMTEKIFLTPILRFFRYKVAWIEHGPLFITPRAAVIKGLHDIIITKANLIIAVSKGTKKDLIMGGVNGNKIKVVYIGVNFNETSKISDLPIPNAPRAKVIGFVGTLNKEKGIDDFIDIALALLKENKHLFFLIVGGGSLRKNIESIIKMHNLQKNFLLVGFVNNIYSYLERMDVVLFPTNHSEGISIAILEALAAKRLVIARDIGGNSELVIDNKTGYLFKTINNKLIKLIVRVLYDKKYNIKLTLNSQNYIKKHFNQKIQSIKFSRLFKTI